MRISRSILGVVGAAGLLAAQAAGALCASNEYRSKEDALRQGVGSYTGGYYEQAVPALEFAAKDDGSAESREKKLVADFYLARIYSDNVGSRTDHAKAYQLYRGIVEDHGDIDPDDDRFASLVGRSLIALAGYVRTGLPEIGLKPDLDRAAEYLHNAAVIFNSDDAQFELAKLQLQREENEGDIERAKHWLATLSRKGHAGAMAFLADLQWRGKFMPRDPVRALALITVAVRNAPPSERVWIEDIYQNIYCGTSEGARKQATGVVAGWANTIGTPKPTPRDRSGLPELNAQVDRTCENGDPVVMPPESRAGLAESREGIATPSVPGAPPRFLRGDAVGTGLRDVGATGTGEAVR